MLRDYRVLLQSNGSTRLARCGRRDSAETITITTITTTTINNNNSYTTTSTSSTTTIATATATATTATTVWRLRGDGPAAACGRRATG